MNKIRFGGDARSRFSRDWGRRARPTIVVIGVSGCGKSTVGRRLATVRGAVFLEADLYHATGAVAKMRAGVALSDLDRWPWLNRIARAVSMRRRDGRAVVVACSALKRSYRARLVEQIGGDVVFVHLTLDPRRLAHRLHRRRDHFMSVALLESQLATLEPLAPCEVGTTIAVDESARHVVSDIERWLVGWKSASFIKSRRCHFTGVSIEKGWPKPPFPTR